MILDDGSRIEGTLVEYVDRDHVTLELEGGERRRLEWSHIRSVGDGDPAALAPLQISRDAPVLVDWPEPDRSAPNIPATRLSIGLEGMVGGPLGSVALEAEFARQWGTFQLGVHAAYGLHGPIGPAISTSLSLDWAYGTWLQQGLGIGVARGFRSSSDAMSGDSDQIDYFVADVGHVNIFVSRQIQIRASLGMAGALDGSCKSVGCVGVPLGLYGLGAVLWNFGGDQ